MKIRVGYELIYDFPQPTPMILVLGTHLTRASDVIVPDYLITDPAVTISPYRDVYGNWCSRLVAPAGRIIDVVFESKLILSRACRDALCDAAFVVAQGGNYPCRQRFADHSQAIVFHRWLIAVSIGRSGTGNDQDDRPRPFAGRQIDRAEQCPSGRF